MRECPIPGSRRSVGVAVVNGLGDLDRPEQDREQADAAAAGVVRPSGLAGPAVGPRQPFGCARRLPRNQADPLPRLALLGEGEAIRIAAFAPAADDDILGSDA